MAPSSRKTNTFARSKFTKSPISRASVATTWVCPESIRPRRRRRPRTAPETARLATLKPASVLGRQRQDDHPAGDVVRRHVELGAVDGAEVLVAEHLLRQAAR